MNSAMRSPFWFMAMALTPAGPRLKSLALMFGTKRRKSFTICNKYNTFNMCHCVRYQIHLIIYG